MGTILIIVHVGLCILLIAFVLLQRSESDGFGLGSGSGSNLLSGRQSANFMTRGTAIIATLFMVNSLVLSILAADGGEKSILDKVQEDGSTVESPATPNSPLIPLEGASGTDVPSDVKAVTNTASESAAGIVETTKKAVDGAADQAIKAVPLAE